MKEKIIRVIKAIGKQLLQWGETLVGKFIDYADKNRKKVFIGAVVILILILFVSCSSTATIPTTITPKESVRIEYRDRVERDTVHVKDSVYVDRWREGDTVYINKVKLVDRYVERYKMDTAYISQTDTIVVTNTQIVERELTWWQTTRLKAFPWLMIMVVGCGLVIYFMIKR